MTDTPPTRRRPASTLLRTHALLAAVAFVGAWLFVALVVFPDRGSAGLVTVPAVTGLTYDDASQRLTKAGLKASLGESRLSGEAPRSTVLSQNPPAGSRIQTGEPVRLDISAGQERSTIPALAGKSRAEAEGTLHAAGLQPGKITEQESDRARGTVLSTQPPNGQVVPAGTAVNLVVSSGPAQLSMPDVVGRSLDEAKGTIEQLGLALGEIGYDSTSVGRPGEVLAQNPLAGVAVAPGATVILRVSGKP